MSKNIVYKLANIERPDIKWDLVEEILKERNHDVHRFILNNNETDFFKNKDSYISYYIKVYPDVKLNHTAVSLTQKCITNYELKCFLIKKILSK